jgi:hypothetical protein
MPSTSWALAENDIRPGRVGGSEHRHWRLVEHPSVTGEVRLKDPVSASTLGV